MNVHYINILLFTLPLNILAHNNNNKPSIAAHHTPTNRSLCECELYAPVNYDNDPQMKEVMDNFSKQTQQRFHEYDERLQSKRKHCKDRCDKEIQKIILKDKLEKELMDKFATLDTDIQSDAIPTCVCEKSIADKTENFCLNCGTSVGVALPGLGVLGAYGAHSMVQIAMAAAENLGIKLATKAGIKAGIEAAIAKIKEMNAFSIIWNVEWSKYITKLNYNTVDGLAAAAESAMNSIGKPCASNPSERACDAISAKYRSVWLNSAVEAGEEAAEAKTAEMTTIYTTEQLSKVTNAGAILSNPIIVSFIVILIVVIILLIMYLVLRHRRRKKLKKKLHYIKLLEE
ncbi:rifin PIR protein, putative [Plasmodium reichenowi]|uniref:Rifin PIR protein, putative n=1 Tax=Plasmodium reichenowi TaxID=5854 RepID=A0A2P9DCJ3_PLARE|nr:rifin PIR protein, putative [Plasmodium reichenowi]